MAVPKSLEEIRRENEELRSGIEEHLARQDAVAGLAAHGSELFVVTIEGGFGLHGLPNIVTRMSNSAEASSLMD